MGKQPSLSPLFGEEGEEKDINQIFSVVFVLFLLEPVMNRITGCHVEILLVLQGRQINCQHSLPPQNIKKIACVCMYVRVLA